MRRINWGKVKAMSLSKQEIINAIGKTIDSLEAVARSPQLPAGIGPEVAALAPIGAAAYQLAKDILESGQDPVEVITRMRQSSVWLDETEAAWRARLAQKFGG